jgi:hypothetical protein
VTDALPELATEDPAKEEEVVEEKEVEEGEEGPRLRRGVPLRGVCTLDMMRTGFTKDARTRRRS